MKPGLLLVLLLLLLLFFFFFFKNTAYDPKLFVSTSSHPSKSDATTTNKHTN
jgi:hypothetical protein